MKKPRVYGRLQRFRDVIINWALNSNVDDKNINRIARLMLEEDEF
jgi:hypothetical protein